MEDALDIFSYRLRAGVRDASGKVPAPVLDVLFAANNNADAIAAARNHPVDTFIGAGDYAWLTDKDDKIIWFLKLEEVEC
jgi:hypothetical protein